MLRFLVVYKGNRRFKQFISIMVAMIGFLLFNGFSSQAQTPAGNEILVKFTKNAAGQLNVRQMKGGILTGIQGFDRLSQQFKLTKMERIFRPAGKFESRHVRFGLDRFYKLTFEPGVDLEKAANLIQKDTSTEFAQISRRYKLHGGKKEDKLNFIPNDPLFPQQWHYNNTGQTGGTPDADIDAPEAWDIETGDPSVIVSDLDTGQDLDHPDLAANIWVNPGEIPGNGIDDDGNGYIDDVNGWDFSDNDNDPDDYHGHGSHTAGTIAAVTNNGVGVAGVAFNAKVMPCKIFPNATDPVIAEAFTYAADNGSIVSSNSWGYSAPGPPSAVLEAAIDYYLATTNGVVVFSAGNDNSNDPTWGYPASYPPVVAVAATDHNDVKASFSNWGDWVDVSAPGVNVMSTVIGDYDVMSGTSMACPHAAGVAALIFSANPGWTGAQVRAQLEASTDNIDDLNPGFAGLLGTGRINAHKALSGGPFPNPPTNLQANVTGNDVGLTWNDPTQNTDGSPINPDHISIYRDGVEIAQVNFGVETYSDLAVPDGQHSYFVTAWNAEGEESGPSNVVNLLIGNFDVLIWQHPEVTQVDVRAKAAERGLTLDEVKSMVQEPRSALAIQDALTANNKSSIIVENIVGIDLSQFQAVFAVVGIYPNNHLILANSDEALALQDYAQNGGKLYMEGGDVWYYDPQFAGGHDFGPLFGINALEDGASDLSTILGVPGTFTEGLDFVYTGENNWIDRLAPVAPAFTVHQNSSPSYDCGIANNPGTYKTIGTSFQFGGLQDGVSVNQTKEELMAAYIDFLGLPVGPTEAVIWLPDDVLEPNMAKKASERGLTLEQVQSLKVKINSHQELKAALEANGKTVQIVNDLTTTDLSQTNYLFIVLGIYPNNHVIKNTDPEVQIINDFRTNGGKRVYIEGGDVWYYDPHNLNGYDFAPDFGIDPQEDGVNDLKTVLGSGAAETLDFVYKGTNNFIDRIATLPGALLFHRNLVPLYGCGVGYDPGTGPRTIGNSFQFGGLADSSLSSATKTELMAQYLQFLDQGLGCQITVLAPNGGEILVAGETFEIQWTSTNTGGTVTIEFSSDGGATYNTIAGPGEPDDGSFLWTIPNIESDHNLIKIIDDSDPDCNDVSDNEFSIVPYPPEWETPISINAIASQTRGLPEIKSFDLSFGGHPSATDGFDPGLDVPAAPPGFNYYAYFHISELPFYLSTDIRGWVPPFDTDIDWTLKVVNADGITSEMTWDPSALPPQGSFTLKEQQLGIAVNMRDQSSIQFNGNGDFVIEYRYEICVTYDFPVETGAWYLVSLPVIPADNSVTTLFPDALAAFGWDYATQNYYSTSQIEPERAYWLLFLQAATAEVCGLPLSTYTNSYDVQGWDMIGSVLETSPLIDNPPGSVLAMFGWDPLGQTYVPITPPYTAEPQQGYWILVFGVPSTVTLGGGSPVSTAKSSQSAALASALEKFGSVPPGPPFPIEQMRKKLIPKNYGLSQNYPNPFNPETVIEYTLPKAGHVSLAIFTILGQKVRTLIDGEKPAGVHRVKWDAKNDAGQSVAPGIYIYRIQIGKFSQSRKVILLK